MWPNYEKATYNHLIQSYINQPLRHLPTKVLTIDLYIKKVFNK